MLVVLDTSIIIAAFLSKNIKAAPNLILTYWQKGSFTLVMTPQILEEIVVVLKRKNIPEDLILSFISTLNNLALFKKGEYLTNFLDDIDPKDNIFLGASYESKADYLVSLDADLLNNKYFYGTQIVNPASFIIFLNDG